MLRSVLFPAPDGPQMATNSPGSTVNPRPSSATVGGFSNCLRSIAIRRPLPAGACARVLTASVPKTTGWWCAQSYRHATAAIVALRGSPFVLRRWSCRRDGRSIACAGTRRLRLGTRPASQRANAACGRLRADAGSGAGEGWGTVPFTLPRVVPDSVASSPPAVQAPLEGPQSRRFHHQYDRRKGERVGEDARDVEELEEDVELENPPRCCVPGARPRGRSSR